jgi:hypothetical protein
MSNEIKFTLRVPIDLYEKLKALAAKEHRSLHAQVIHMLYLAVELWDKSQLVKL